MTLDWLRGVSTRGQKDFNALYPHFDTDTQTIRISVPQLSDEEVALSLMKVIAGAHVAHNMVQVPTQGGFAKRLSVGLYWYPDGLAVTTATAPFAAALGTRVIRIGNLTPEQALANTAPYISYENNVWLR
ncbi:MAG: hypothetical protein IAI48_07275, partial [Candidatus Eremiobacteraeota bacterium]|nr:hypothetical protein [Candidatus Eremiobacteraeota bacterium]